MLLTKALGKALFIIIIIAIFLLQDIESPVFDNGCPDNMEVNAARLGQATFVSWTAPTLSDNSGDIIQLASDVTSGSAFPPGRTVVTYKAEDSSGNTNTCHFNITVTGTT